MKKNLFCLVLVCWSLSVRADVTLPHVFSDNMVLQADLPIEVWGKAEPGERVVVTLAESSVEISADADGAWSVQLPAMKYGGPYDLTVQGRNQVVFKNVMLGEVWLCLGQSNMRWRVASSMDAEQEIRAADYPNIRLLEVPLKGNDVPQDDVDVRWNVCSPESVQNMSAVGYFFGRELFREMNVPVGLICCAYGGAKIATFMDAETIRRVPGRAVIQKADQKAHEQFKAQMQDWNAAGCSGKKPSLKVQQISSRCYNGMYSGIIPYKARGAVWYQGESDADQPILYVKWFEAYLEMMRSQFKRPDMPFYYVELAGFSGMSTYKIPPRVWARFRAMQERCLQFDHVGMATAIDIGDSHNVHPKNKQEVGRRLALLALNQTYGRDVVCCGPVAQEISVDGDALAVRFSDCVDGLKAVGEGAETAGFVGVVDNGKEIPLAAKIVSPDTVEVDLQGTSIKRLRYAWANDPVCSLYNSAGLPARPFDRPVK